MSIEIIPEGLWKHSSWDIAQCLHRAKLDNIPHVNGHKPSLRILGARERWRETEGERDLSNCTHLGHFEIV